MGVLARGAQAHRDSFLLPTTYAGKYASHNLADASFVDLPGAVANNGTPRAFKVSLPDGFVFTKMTWFAGTTAIGTPLNQWCAILDSALTVIATSADRTTTAWAAGAAKEFTFSSTSLRRPPGVYYAALVIVATTAPSLKGTLDIDTSVTSMAPIMSGASSTTGLTTPSAAGTVFGALTASAAKPLVLIG